MVGVVGEHRPLSEQLAAHVQRCAVCGPAADLLAVNEQLFDELVTVLPKITGPRRLPEIPGYTILSEIHRGGQGVVYAAQQLGTQRRVALKLLRGDTFASPLQRRRFEREIEIVASFDHPNIVTVFESGATADGEPYLAMELVDGVPLHRYLEAKRPDHSEVIALFQAICGGVEFAHQRGVLHRDLKPGNVLVDAEGAPRIVDFGLAKNVAMVGDAASDALTSPGIFVVVQQRQEATGQGAQGLHQRLGPAPYPARHPRARRTREPPEAGRLLGGLRAATGLRSDGVGRA